MNKNTTTKQARRTQMRQGDVFLRPIDVAPKDAVPAPDGLILARGEVTGHKHRLTGGHVVRSGSQTFAVLDEPQRLVHEEHAQLHVPKGVYEVVIQREYVESSERRVTD